jgi:hypothetical protein
MLTGMGIRARVKKGSLVLGATGFVRHAPFTIPCEMK